MYLIEKNALRDRACFFGALFYSLTSAFALSPWLNLSTIGSSIVAAVALAMLLTGRMRRVDSNGVVILSFVLVMLTLISAAFAVTSFEEKLANHTSARIFTILALYMLPYMLLDANAQVTRSVQLGLTTSLVFTVLLICYDALRLNGIFDIGIVSHTDNIDSLEALARGYIYRARGGAFEPGHDASIIAAILPIAVAQLRLGLRIIVVITISLLVYLLGFSISLMIWLILFTSLHLFFTQTVSFKFRILPYLSVCVAVAVLFYGLDDLEIVADIKTKFLSASFVDRSDSLEAILDGSGKDLTTFLFGYGPGGYLVLDVAAVTNTFAGFLLDVGALGLLVYLSAIVYSLTRLWHAKNPVYTAGFIAYVIVFGNSVGNYWFPTHWLFLLYPCFAKLHHVASTVAGAHQAGNLQFVSRPLR